MGSRHAGQLAILSILPALLMALHRPANAAACCLSTSVFGVGRLAIWEVAAAGLMGSFAATTGRFDTNGKYRGMSEGVVEDELDVAAWGIVRISEAWQIFGRAPWVVGLRDAPHTDLTLGQGLGDIQTGVRWDIIGVGEFHELPGIAFTGTVLYPTGRRPEVASDPLGASATGRGSWVLGLGATLERAVLPWFAKLDVGATYAFPFTRRDTGVAQQFGPGIQCAVSGGAEIIADVLVIGGQLLLSHEMALSLDHQTVAGSQATSVTTGLSSALKLDSTWTVSAGVSTDILGRVFLGRNRPERASINVGLRYGFL